MTEHIPPGEVPPKTDPDELSEEDLGKVSGGVDDRQAVPQPMADLAGHAPTLGRPPRWPADSSRGGGVQIDPATE